MAFSDSLKVILVHEGGYANDKDDPGGATNKGITQGVYDSFRRSVDLPTRSVQYVSKAEVERIYLENYWNDGKCNMLPIGVNLVHFDFAVNAGIGQAAKTLQRCLGVDADGVIGPKTINAAASYADGIESLIYSYSNAREAFYRSIVTRNPKLDKFLKGWILRTKSTREKAIKAYQASIKGKVDV